MHLMNRTHVHTSDSDRTTVPSTDQVWRELERRSFAVLAHVAPSGSPRSSGVVFSATEHRIFVVTADDSWKSRQIADGDSVALTVPVRRGGLLSLVAPIPPATISFRARALVHPPGSAESEAIPKRLASLLPKARRHGRILELVPMGSFLTYGVGVPLHDMTRPGRASARVPVA